MLTPRWAVIALGAVLVVGGACTDSSSGQRDSSGAQEAEIVFPVQDPAKIKMQALLIGTLIRWGGCLYVSGGERGNLILPIWPAGFSYESADERISVLDAEGKQVAHVGSPIRVGGGLRGEEIGEAPLPPELEPRVQSCDGPAYWIVGDVERPQ